MRLLRFLAVIALSVGTSGCFGCTFIPPGYVGIKVNMYGTNRGVSDLPIVTGRVLYNPWTQTIYEFPTFLQYRSWVQSPNEGSKNDESITFTSQDKIPVNVDVSAAFQFEPDKVPELFVKFRSDPDTIADTYVRSRVRDAFVRCGSKVKAMDILGGGIGPLDAEVKDQVDREMAPIGLRFDYISVLNQPRIPQAIQEAIEQAIESTQRAQQAQNQVAVVKAQADQAVAQATGEANSARARAQGDADALLLRQTAAAKGLQLNKEAEAAGNRAIAMSLSPALIQYTAMQRWQGQVPQWQTGTNNGPIPFVALTPPEK